MKRRFSSVLLPIEHALQRIQRRAATDPTLKPLADAPLHLIGYTDAKGEPTACSLRIGADTDDQIEIPTKGDAVSIKVPGSVGLHIEVSGRQGMNDLVLDGLYNGAVAWKTNNPKVFVKMFWFTKDSGVPDRLLAIVREELGREGFQLLPIGKLDWPAATTAERLSQLLPPDPAPSVAARSVAVTASPQSPASVFVTPNDVVASHNQAVARKDWEAYARCLTPFRQESIIAEVLFVAAMGGKKKCPELIETIEKHLKFKPFDDGGTPGRFVESDESRSLFKGMPPGKDAEAAGGSLYEAFWRRVGDVPAFLADCLRQTSGSPEGIGKPIECEGIRIKGDKESGYWIDRRPAPAPQEAEGRDGTHYLPRYFPLHFRRIGGSWLIE